MDLPLLSRRDMLHRGVSAVAASVCVSGGTHAQEEEPRPFHIIDTNVSLFQWPFRRLPLDDTDALVAKLGSLGITQAWASSFEGLLHRDISAVNRRLADACQHRPQLVPIGALNPELPSWEEDLHRCFEQHKMPGIRIYPNYHGYRLEDRRFSRLLDLATRADRIVQICTAAEDTRTQHPLVRVANVDLAPLPRIMSHFSDCRVQLLNFRPIASKMDGLLTAPGLYFDTARVEATDGVPKLMQQAPTGRVLFGSHAPLLIPEASLIRLNESGLLGEASLHAVLGENAEQLMEKSRV